MDIITLLLAVAAAAIGAGAGYWFRRQYGAKQSESQEKRIDQKVKAAKEKIAELREEADTAARKIRAEAETELDKRREKIIELEQRIADREKTLDTKLKDIERKEQTAEAEVARVQAKEEELKSLRASEEQKIAEISGLTTEQAQTRVLELAEERTKEEIVRRLRKLQTEGEQQLADEARNIMSNIIQRYASSHVAEIATSYVTVSDESMIGRVIGKEGRNIQHLERVTGCEIVIDETPNTIMISCFSPLRRQVAKTALERLLKDGRIHPGRIEDIVEEAKKEINEEIRQAGEEALFDLNIIGFPPKLVHLVGRMKFRTSYRQNILKHSVEAAHIATMLAEELGADVDIAKKATLLHDIGKAIDHDVEGNHVEIGEKIMQKFGIDPRIIKAAAAHHEDYPFETVEAVIVQVADAISAARPGARRENLEQYVKRMQDLENIATSYEGVAKAYAIHAGREIRVFVTPEKVDDLQAIKMAQTIAKQIESELQYPGDVKVNVIRETRAQALAK
jgi:ribonucrease Y